VLWVGICAVLLAGWALAYRAAGLPLPGGQHTIDLADYELTFNEDFDRLDVSAWGPGTRWIAHTPWHGDFGDAEFVDPSPSFPFVVKDGILRITARKGADGKWRSGLLASNDPLGHGFAQRFGYFEMRAKLPPGPGVWPAFWLIGDQSKKARLEIDVMEYYGIDPGRYYSTVHVWPKTNGIEKQTFHRAQWVPYGSLSQGFHTYGVSVEADWIRFYLDREETGRVRTPKAYKGRVYLLLNLALGSGYPIDEVVSPVHMYVDYVRVYRKKRAPAAV
jgi:beta-glucanase (GH16 family)